MLATICDLMKNLTSTSFWTIHHSSHNTLQKSLQFLDICQNKIKALLTQFCCLQKLIHLRLKANPDLCLKKKK